MVLQAALNAFISGQISNTSKDLLSCMKKRKKRCVYSWTSTRFLFFTNIARASLRDTAASKSKISISHLNLESRSIRRFYGQRSNKISHIQQP